MTTTEHVFHEQAIDHGVLHEQLCTNDEFFREIDDRLGAMIDVVFGVCL